MNLEEYNALSLPERMNHFRDRLDPDMLLNGNDDPVKITVALRDSFPDCEIITLETVKEYINHL